MIYNSRNYFASQFIRKERHRDAYLRMDKDAAWYSVNLETFSYGSDLKSNFKQLHFDQETSIFLEKSYETSNSIFLQLFYNISSFILNFFMRKTCINALLNRGSMFLLSEKNFDNLLQFEESCPTLEMGFCTSKNYLIHKEKVALDLGAGDGSISASYKNHFPSIFATEASNSMKRLLTKRNITVFDDLNAWTSDSYHFDAIFCLNLIDRHPKPLSLLKLLRKKIAKDNGLLILAVVLPFYQYVEYPEKGTHGNLATELLNVEGKGFEAQLESLYLKILKPLGFSVLSWSRLPYLSEGDMYANYYVLDDAIFVLKAENSTDA